MTARLTCSVLGAVCCWLAFHAANALAQQPTQPVRQFPSRPAALPVGRLRAQIERLPLPAQERALQWLRSFRFSNHDLASLHADSEGGILYVCPSVGGAVQAANALPEAAAAAEPVSPFPAHLVFHSRPGAPNVLYLDFDGENVTGTQWNIAVNRLSIPAVAFSIDADHAAFSDAEQAAIKRIWQHVAEDYAPFNVDVTTERPLIFNNRTAHVLITRATDGNGDANPHSEGGGVAYVNVFATPLYASHRPAWIYYNNLANNESYIAEAAAHEVGHNLALSHDGTTNGMDRTEYYAGHGSGETSWGPVMGTGYDRNVTQWSKGEYHQANNTEDDLALISQKIPFRTDDHGGAFASATALVVSGGTNIVATTPETDPGNTNTANKGIVELASDVDAFSFITATGRVRLVVSPWLAATGARGGNLDVSLTLYGESGTLLASNNPAGQTSALIQTNLAAGRYYLRVRNSSVGDPLAALPTGYTAYGSLGQYFITGYIAASNFVVNPPAATVQLTDITGPGEGSRQFTVTYTDDVAVSVSTIDRNDLRVIGPNGYDRPASFISVDTLDDGTPRVATYAVDPPLGSAWLPGDNGTYAIRMQAGEVGDVEGAWVPAGQLGQFTVAVPIDGELVVTPVADFASAGPVGGPFSPASMTYSLTNAGGSPFFWVAVNTADWVALSPVAGALAPGETTNVTVSIEGAAGSLMAGDHTDMVQFINITSGTGSTNRLVTLTVHTPGVLEVSPPAGFSALGTAGGPFTPDSITYTLTNSGGSALTWAVEKTVDWLSLSSASGLLQTGAVAEVTVSIGSNAKSLPPGEHSDLISFTNTSSGHGSINRAITLTVNSPGILDVLPPSGLAAMGTVGGPFSPASITYTLTNSGGSALDWHAEQSAGWLSIAPGAGTLEAGSATSVTIAINELASALPVGAYTNMIQFTNASTGGISGARDVTLLVNSTPGELSVATTNDFLSTGSEGGPFTPSSMTYVLTNSGGSSLDWNVTTSSNWLSLSASVGTLEAGAATNVIISLNTNAQTLPAGNYVDAVAFTNMTTGTHAGSRHAALDVTPAPQFELTVGINNPAWGGVTPTNGTYRAGSTVELLAVPAPYHQFTAWTGDLRGNSTNLSLVITGNVSAIATFGEIVTTNFPTPYWWLAMHGYTNDFETAVTNIDANGMPRWQSYVAGLNPHDPQSRLRLSGEWDAQGAGFVLRWQTASNRLYTIWAARTLHEPFLPMAGGLDLPWTTRSFTNVFDGGTPEQFYRISVRQPRHETGATNSANEHE